ncbi:MAG: hypothetical protein ACRDXE_00660, partial [Acidimicrobiales bacterium]
RARRRLDAEPGAGSTLRHRLARAVAAAEGNPTDRGLVVLVSARQLALFRLPFEPRDRVVVDPTFATRDLEVTLRHWPRYRVLVLGPSPRILEGRGRHLADTKRLGIDSGPPALFGAAGRGLGRRSPRPEHWIGRRARHIAGRCQAERLLDERTAVSGVLPLIAIGDDRWLTEFRQHSHHTPNVIGEVRGNRTRSSPLRLAELARPVLARWHLAEQTNQLAALEHADGHGGVAWGLDAAWRAIQHGDADHLWVEVSFARPGRRLPDGEGIQTTTDPEAPGALDDLVDDLIEAAGIGGMRVDLVDDGRLGPPEPIAVHLLAGDHTRSRPASLAAA